MLCLLRHNNTSTSFLSPPTAGIQCGSAIPQPKREACRWISFFVSALSLFSLPFFRGDADGSRSLCCAWVSRQKNSSQLVQFSELPSAHLHLLIFLFVCFPYSPCCYWSCGNEHIKAISSHFFTAPMSSLPPLPLTLILIATVPFFTVAFFLILKGVSLFLDFLLQRTFVWRNARACWEAQHRWCLWYNIGPSSKGIKCYHTYQKSQARFYPCHIWLDFFSLSLS